ncbi:MAG: lipopolysaccharide kinase InaA family protein [Phycisphaerae bacterium]
MLTTDRMVIDGPFRERLASVALDTVSRVLACRGDHLAAWSHTSDSIRVDLPNGDGAVFIKRYHFPRWRHRWRGMFRGVFFRASRAFSEYRNLKHMRRLGIHAVRPVAWGERRIAHFIRSCFLITEAVPNARSLATFVQTFSRRDMVGRRVRVRHEVLSSLAAETRRMHDAGFVHRDLFWRNVLVRPLSGDRFEFYFLDASLGKLVRLRSSRRQKIVHDLAALSVLAPEFCSKSDQLRFVRCYLGSNSLSSDDRAWLLDVQRHWSLYRDAEQRRLQRGRVFESSMTAADDVRDPSATPAM